MPTGEQFRSAIEWALIQQIDDGRGNKYPVSKDMPHELVDKVREYFNANNIQYSTFSYDDLLPFLS